MYINLLLKQLRGIFSSYLKKINKSVKKEKTAGVKLKEDRNKG